MKNLTFDDIEREGLLLYRYVRGSTAQGTAIEGVSDRDTASVYLAHPDQLLGLGFDYQDEVSDERHDNVAWEFNKYMRLLLKSNPTVLESLFVDDEFVEYEHPIITELKKHRDKFVTKQCFKPFGAYAYSQIAKCRGLNKKMLLDEEKYVERRSSYSFCYTFYNQGSTKINNWLAYRGLRAECCGLNRIPNMRDTYGVYYDWGLHFSVCGYTPVGAVLYYIKQSIKGLFRKGGMPDEVRYSEKFCIGRYILCTMPNINKTPYHYRGIFKTDDSSEVRLSSINDKHNKSVCHMSYNEDAYRKHCQDYKEFVDWKKNRNPVRYAQNKDRNYDAKNCSHSFRLMNMCIEIATGKGFIVNRSGIDSDFLLDVRQHKYEYEDMMRMLEEKKKEMDDAIMGSTLPDEIDVDFVNDFVVMVRKEQLKIGK